MAASGAGLTHRRRKLAIIHVAKRELALDDECYRALLEGAAGVRSAADISTDRQYAAVMTAFKRAGFSGNSGFSGGARRTPANPQLGKCYALWCHLYERGGVESKGYESMMNYVRRMVGDQDIYRQDQLSLVIESLKRWIARVDRNSEGGGVSD